MGGEGSIQHMINSLKNNKKLLRQKSRFEEGKKITRSDTALSNKLKAKKASPVLLEQIRKEAKRSRRKWSILYLIVILVTVVPVFYGIYSYNQNLVLERKAKIKERKERSIKYKNEQFKTALKKGGYYMDKQDYNAAVNSFITAYNSNPNDYDTAYKLAHALCLSCTKNDYRCEGYNRLLKMLYDRYPNKHDELDKLNLIANKEVNIK